MDKTDFHILFIQFEYPPIFGGGGVYTNNLINELIKLGVKVTICTSGEEDSIESPTERLSIRRYKLFKDLYEENTGFLRGMDLVLDTIREIKPDLLHTSYIHETLIVSSVNKNFELPHFVSILKTPLYRLESVRKNSTWTLFDYLLETDLYSKFICPSQAYMNGLLQQGVTPHDIKLIYPGINREIFRKISDTSEVARIRKKIGIQENEKLILIPCVPRKRKGLKFALEAINGIENQNIKVLISGLPQVPAEFDVMKELKEIDSEKILLNQKYFANGEMPLLYSIADATLLPSEAEGLGLALLEAMACECPIIGTDVIGIREVIDHEVNGLLTEYGNVVDLQEKIVALLNDNKLRQKFKENAQITLNTKFNLPKQAKDHVELYQKVMEAAPSQTPFIIFKRVDQTAEILFQEDSNNKKMKLPYVDRCSGISPLESIISKAQQEMGCELITPFLSIYDDSHLDQTQQDSLSHKPIIYSFDTTKQSSTFNDSDTYIWLPRTATKIAPQSKKLLEAWWDAFKQVKNNAS